MGLFDSALAIVNILPEFVTHRFTSRSLIARFARPLVNRIAPDQPILMSIAGGYAKGLRLCMEPRSEKFYWTGLHELHVQAAILENLEEGQTFWDVGAHIGMMTVLAARRVGSAGTVHSFEPMAFNRQRLACSVAANPFDNIEIHSEALGESDGEVFLHGHRSSLMWTLENPNPQSGGERVKCVTLDSLKATLMHAPHLVKIDAEGLEVGILRGAQNLIAECSPRFIVEFHSQERVQIARELMPSSYSFLMLGANHWLLRPS